MGIGRTGTRREQGAGALLRRISALEWVSAAIAAAVLLVLVLVEPDILDAPFQNLTTILFTLGGTVLAAVVLWAMLRRQVPPAVRAVVLLVPFVAVNWWLLEPYFVDDVVDEEFATTIADQLEGGSPAGAAEGSAETDDPPTTPTDPPAEEPTGEPVLVGAGSFRGLAGHDGTGAAGVFRVAGGSQVLRFEDFDIENGPDLEVYVVPGAEQTAPAEGSLHLGSLKGNVGDQSYQLPPGRELAPGDWTVLVWCEVFSVEFVGATVTIS